MTDDRIPVESMEGLEIPSAQWVVDMHDDGRYFVWVGDADHIIEDGLTRQQAYELARQHDPSGSYAETPDD